MKTFEERYNIIVNLIITVNRMNNVHAKFMSLKSLIENEVNPVNLRADSRQLYEAAKELIELKKEYQELRKALDKEAGCVDIWALEAIDNLTK